MRRFVNPNSLDNLTHIQPKWNSGKTTTVRIPIAIKDKILEYAKIIDTDNTLSSDKIINLYNYINSIKDKIKNKENGYNRKNSGELLRNILNLID